MKAPALAATISLLAGQGGATSNCLTDAMIVFDGSASMGEINWDPTARTRIEEARVALHEALPQIAAVRRLGLLTYGTGSGGACSSLLVFPPISDAAPRITAEVDGLEPGGLTPLTASVEAAADVLNYRSTPATVVLVTDGNETCGGMPCATGKRLEREARDLTIHVIGFRVFVDFFSWDNPEQKTYSEGTTVAKCLADATGGTFTTTKTIAELVTALDETLGCSVIGRLE